MMFPFHSAQEKGMVYQKQILLETQGNRQRHGLTPDVAPSLPPQSKNKAAHDNFATCPGNVSASILRR